MTLLAKDVMTSEVVTVLPDTPLREVITILEDNSFSGIPVVDESNRIVGIASETDILHYTQQVIGHPIKKPYELLKQNMEVLHVNALHRGVELIELVASASIEKLMSRNVISVQENTSIKKVVESMHEHNINRVPVVSNDGEITGLISREDIIRALSDNWHDFTDN